MERICIFCGSSEGTGQQYVRCARDMGQALLDRKLGLVYGGGNIGLMRVLADTVMAGGGDVVGVIPHGLERREVAHRGISELHVVASMHERKAMMASLSDAFITLPGGLGTLEELLEIVTWAQLGIHRKAVGILNSGGYFDGLLAFLSTANRKGFIPQDSIDALLVEQDPYALLDRLADYQPPYAKPWLDLDQT